VSPTLESKTFKPRCRIARLRFDNHAQRVGMQAARR
jgi:hypothetical protein